MQKQELVRLLVKLGIRPNKLKGQNFLVEDDIIPRMIAAADLRAGETVVEVGPGLGVLTRELLNAGARVIAIEQERQFGEYLRKKFKGSPLSVLIGNAVLKIPELKLPKDYKVVSNLPYAITSPVVNLFLTCSAGSGLTRVPVRPSRLVLMVQKEVAERLTAPPGRKARGILTVLIELLGAARIVKRVGTEAFYPPPKVESAIIEIDVRSRELETADVERIMKVVKFGFSKRRAQLKNVFKKYPSAQSGVSLLASAGINGTLRAEDLTADDWRKLAKFISDK